MSTELATIIPAATAEPIPAFTGQVPGDLRQAIRQAVDAWLLRTPSPHTRRAYEHDLNQFLAAIGVEPDAWEQLAAIRPEHVSQWRDRLAAAGMSNSSIRRKLTALRSLFSGYFPTKVRKVPRGWLGVSGLALGPPCFSIVRL